MGSAIMRLDAVNVMQIILEMDMTVLVDVPAIKVHSCVIKMPNVCLLVSVDVEMATLETDINAKLMCRKLKKFLNR